MSIFANVIPTKKNPETELFIKLKYGQPALTLEYLDSLPETVIREAYRIAGGERRPYDVETLRQVLTIMYRQPANQKRAIEAVQAALYNYHLLYSSA